MPWIMLLLAILFEVTGTIFIKYAQIYQCDKLHLITFVAICISYFFFAKAIRTIPLGVAYALWEGIGILLIVSLSYLLFQESVSAFKLLGFVFIICGIACLKFGVVKPPLSG
ncbi:multidrug efflux SMR transporter [Serratia proteamaculans]|jgi:spermidine export protein MdtJ|uniref:DMT family transporter n=1 Tax=Serratia proteamaculans TaxID=28151 RepID=UPI0021795922|nr:multidrug efflux SMR transporter [Serratia proteamaculans]CAI1195322.1 Spermidine export protein MdtJ [Serratia proteamaculans]CAI1964994.1 Spermidine export protein MdtJ [Serratia proteamaculans]CAI1973367.1 Spermidine export protein MdtJ [Serratia proteamaculans]CAI2501112.1 Spermidine export protein MdtJ [Serratia proteamaculans]